uniref:Uncharacterized protein n=1 Tax=Opuntia streptacantha TaxID=393608 RepID=A0A7C9A5B7_OPUST
MKSNLSSNCILSGATGVNFSSLFTITCRWSRIARRLPGRTDNEIKNYWRTHMRKKAQESKRTAAPSSPSTSNLSSSSSTDPAVNSTEEIMTSFQSVGGPDMSAQ